MIERRTTATEVRAEGGKITGLASPTYQPGNAGTEYQLWEDCFERFAPGAFDVHLRSGEDVKCMVDHRICIARTSAGNLALRTDAQGLHYEAHPPPDHSAVKDLLVSITAGNAVGSSFSFSADEVDWQEDGERSVRMIKRAKLYDVAPMCNQDPAYGSTSCQLRSEERAELEKERAEFRARLETEKRLARVAFLTGKTA